jgi:hypothetical protein
MYSFHNSVIQHQTSARNAEHALLTVAINKCTRVFQYQRQWSRRTQCVLIEK